MSTKLLFKCLYKKMLCCCRKVTVGSATKKLEVSVVCELTE